jgi:hypothetical protein
MAVQICRHIKTNGKRCGSPALSGLIFCFFHRELHHFHEQHEPSKDNTETVIHSLVPQRPGEDGSGQREPVVAEQISSPAAKNLEFPLLEDRESIQVAISMLVGALAAGRIDPARANTLLYGLQVASSNCRNLILEPYRDDVVTETEITDFGYEVAG